MSSQEPVTRRQGADERKTLVLEAAVQAIAERGADRVRVADIAKIAGMSPGHVLYYFGRRDRILLETLEWSERQLAEERGPQLERAPTADAKLALFVELYLPSGPDDARWALWAQVWARPPAERGDLDELDGLDGLWASDLAAIVRAGQERGDFNDRVDADGLALRTCLLLDGIALELLVGSPRLPRARAAELALAALRAELAA